MKILKGGVDFLLALYIGVLCKEVLQKLIQYKRQSLHYFGHIFSLLNVVAQTLLSDLEELVPFSILGRSEFKSMPSMKEGSPFWGNLWLLPTMWLSSTGCWLLDRGH